MASLREGRRKGEKEEGREGEGGRKGRREVERKRGEERK